jgi:hypothetical protein
MKFLIFGFVKYIIKFRRSEKIADPREINIEKKRMSGKGYHDEKEITGRPI